MLGTTVNLLAIVFGGIAGILFGKAFPEKLKNTLIQGIGLTVIIIGLQMALKTNNVLIVIASLVVGGIIGETIDIEESLNNLGRLLEKKLSGGGEGKFTKAFVTTSLIYCVGAMAIVGALEDGLNGNHSILFAKSALDGITAIIFASSMGVGVIFSAIPVFIYQGGIALFAGLLQGILSDLVVLEMSAVGGLLIFGIGINMLGIKEIKVGNLLPGIFIAVPLVLLTEQLGF
ncbi:MAG: DUF554 domain-containing protein [Desulfitobacteriia bacterium]|jgi:uncharacterized membrane protein YqgA involved in biofilm formation